MIEVEENRILVAEDITSDEYEAIKVKSISKMKTIKDPNYQMLGGFKFNLITNLK